MSTLRVNTLQNAAGTGQPAMSGAAKAWVNFNGTGTVAIRASFNVTSITDNGTGDYTVNLTNALEDANFSISGAIGGTSSAFLWRDYSDLTARTTSLFRLTMVNTSFAQIDPAQVNIAVFR